MHESVVSRRFCFTAKRAIVELSNTRSLISATFMLISMIMSLHVYMPNKGFQASVRLVYVMEKATHGGL